MFKLLNPWMLVAVMVAVSTAGGAGYWRGSVNTKNRLEAQAAREERIAQMTYEKAMAATASEISKIKVVNKTITQELEREVRTEPVYIDCRHSDDVKRLLDAILTGQAPAESLDRSVLPPVNAPE